MTIRGHVKNGVVVLDEPGALPEGAEVAVRLVKAKRPGAKGKKKPPTLAERLGPVIGKAKNLPADASVNLDHYLYSFPKTFHLSRD